MKPIIKFYMCDSSGRITFTEKEFKELVDEVYNQGFEDGKNKSKLTPFVINPCTPPDYDWAPKITCDGEVDWSKISTSSTPQTGRYTTTTNLYSKPTITNSATMDWARIHLSNKDKE